MRATTYAAGSKRLATVAACRRMAAAIFAIRLSSALLCAAEPGVLPIFFADNHAASFGWFARTVDLDEPHALLMIDAHSDASAVDHSDEVREKLRRVVSPAERRERVEAWRKTGRIQAYNWMEPLLPAPVDRVIWMARWEQSPEKGHRLLAAARVQVDGRLEFEARASGELADRWSLLEGRDFSQWTPPAPPLLATIDLDFFSEMTPDEQAARFALIWQRLLSFPNLRGVSFSISRPWQRDNAQAARLFLTALHAARLVRGAQIELEPFEAPGPDDSLKATDFARSGRTVPRFDFARAPAEIRSLLVAGRRRWIVASGSAERWNALLDTWAQEFGHREIHADGAEPSTDEIWRIPQENLPALRIWNDDERPTPQRTRWWQLKSAGACYNLAPDLLLGQGFTGESSPWVREDRIALGETEDGALPPERWSTALDAKTGLGVARIEAEVETATGWVYAGAIELRVFSGAGFHAGLSEQLGLPYVFGIAYAHTPDGNGPDLGWGNDCANFLIAAWRRTGRDLRWGDPAILARQLKTLAEDASPSSAVPITREACENGLAIDFRHHDAALWEDREPKGVLDANDLVVHHLSGFPEITTLGQLAAAHGHFAVRTPKTESIATLRIGGDVVLSGKVPRPAASGRTPETHPELVLANLEGIPAGPEAPAGQRFNFSFPAERLRWLHDLGINAVGVANNHSGDATARGVVPGLEFVRAMGIGTTGAGANITQAVTPWGTEVAGLRFSVFALAAVDSLAATADSPGVAAYPAAAPELAAAIEAAKRQGSIVVVLTHWGTEYSHSVDPEQRQLARWLIDCGADVVAGAHPHVVQPLDFYRGKCIAYSLGNLLFPSRLNGLGEGAWLEVEFNDRGRITNAKLVPVPK